MPGGLLRTLLAAGSLWFIFYPRKSTWDILSCVLNNASFFLDEGQIKVLLLLNTTIILNNPNRVGTQLKGASYDLFFFLPTNPQLRIGRVDIGNYWIPGNGKLSVTAMTKINITIGQGFELLSHIYSMSGQIQVSAIGAALVHIDAKQAIGKGKKWMHLSKIIDFSGANTGIVVKGSCYEKFVVNLFSTGSLIRLYKPPAQNCSFHYKWKKI